MYYETDGVLDIFTYIDESTGAVPKKAESEYKGHIILLSSMTPNLYYTMQREDMTIIYLQKNSD